MGRYSACVPRRSIHGLRWCTPLGQTGNYDVIVWFAIVTSQFVRTVCVLLMFPWWYIRFATGAIGMRKAESLEYGGFNGEYIIECMRRLTRAIPL